jgi:hypothetical protein
MDHKFELAFTLPGGRRRWTAETESGHPLAAFRHRDETGRTLNSY